MTDLSEDAAWEAWRNAPQREEWELRDAQMGFGGGFAAAREYSKQREEELLWRIRVHIDQVIVDPRLRTANELEKISQLVLAALAENGDSDGS